MINRVRKEWVTHCLLQGKEDWSYELADYNIHIIYTDGKAAWAIRFVRTENSYTLCQQINIEDVGSDDSDVLKDLLDRGEKVYIADWLGELRLWAKTHPWSPCIKDVNDALKLYEGF